MAPDTGQPNQAHIGVASRWFEKLSICEQYDVLNQDLTSGDGPNMQIDDPIKRLATLNARFDNEVAIVTQKNLMVSETKDATPTSTPSFKEKQRVYINIWFSSPGERRVWLTHTDGNGERRTWPVKGSTSIAPYRREIVLGQNRLRGEHLGFRFFTYRIVHTTGTHTLEVFNERHERLCQRSFNVTG
jgi:hypothetical protein